MAGCAPGEAWVDGACRAQPGGAAFPPPVPSSTPRGATLVPPQPVGARAARPRMPPPPLRIGAGLDVGHAVQFDPEPWSGDAEAAGSVQLGATQRTLTLVRAEASPVPWFTVSLLGAWSHLSAECSNQTVPAGGRTITGACPASIGADQWAIGLGFDFRVPIQLPEHIELAPFAGLAGLLFPAIRSESVSWAVQLRGGVRATWRFEPRFGVWASAGAVLDVYGLAVDEAGLHPLSSRWFSVAPLVGGVGALGFEATFDLAANPNPEREER